MAPKKRKPTPLPNSDTGKRIKVRHEDNLEVHAYRQYDHIHLGKNRALADYAFQLDDDSLLTHNLLGFGRVADHTTVGNPTQILSAEEMSYLFGEQEETLLERDELFGIFEMSRQPKGGGGEGRAEVTPGVQMGFDLMRTFGIGAHTPTSLGMGPVGKLMYLTMMKHDTHAVVRLFEKLNMALSNHETTFQERILTAYECHASGDLAASLKLAWTRTTDEYSSWEKQSWLRPSIPAQGENPLFDRIQCWCCTSVGKSHRNPQLPVDPASDMVHFFGLFDQDLFPESCDERKRMTQGPTLPVPLVPRYLKHLNYWDDLPHPDTTKPLPSFEEPDGIRWNTDFQRHMSELRTSFLAPQLNLTELSNPYLLLSLVHKRGRFHPSYFANADNDATYLGRQSRLLSGIVVEPFMVSFSDQPQPMDLMSLYNLKDHAGDKTYADHQEESTDSFFEDHLTWLQYALKNVDDQQRQRLDQLRREGKLFTPAEAWIIIQRQMFILLFLSQFVEITLEEGKEPLTVGSDLGDQLGHLSRAQDLIEGPVKQKYEVMDPRSLQSEIPLNSIPDLSVPIERLSAKRTQATERIRNLFNDGEFLYSAAEIHLDHHWTNLKLKTEGGDLDIHPKYATYSEKDSRWDLYRDVLKTILRRSVFEFFMWDTAWRNLKHLDKRHRNYHPERFASCHKVDWTNGPGVISKPEFPSSQMYDDCWELQKDIQNLVRYYAMFFWNEFRNKSIHASSSNVSKFFSVPRVDPQDRTLPCEHYGANPRIVDFDEFATPAPEEEATVHFAEVVNTFLGDRTASMHIGIRKVTEYLQTLIDTSGPKPCTPLVSETIDSLGLLATITDTLELQWSSMLEEGKKSVAERQKTFRATASPFSIDLLEFDDFQMEEYIEKKRLDRLYSWFDEMQGFHESPDAPLHLGRAKGACRRLGYSLMQKFIRPKNATARFQADEDALKRLEDAMGLEWGHRKMIYSATGDDEDSWNAEPNTKPPRMTKMPEDYKKRLTEFETRTKAYQSRQAGNFFRTDKDKQPWRKGNDVSLNSFKKAHTRKLERRERENAKRLERLRENKVGVLGTEHIYGRAKAGPANDDGWDDEDEDIHDAPEEEEKEMYDAPEEEEYMYETPEDGSQEEVNTVAATLRLLDLRPYTDNTQPGASLWDEAAKNKPVAAPWSSPPDLGSPWTPDWAYKVGTFGIDSDGNEIRYHRSLEWDIDPWTGQYITSHVDSVTGQTIDHPYLDRVPSTHDVGDHETRPLHLLAPDHKYKRVIGDSSIWETLETIFAIQHETKKGKKKAHTAVSWSGLVVALRVIGYEENVRKCNGSHRKFERQPWCRWPTTLRKPGASDISMHSPHGHMASSRDPGSVDDFGKSLREQGVDYEMIKQWYMQELYDGTRIHWAPPV